MLSAVADPITTSPFNNVTAELASALPVIVGVEVFTSVATKSLGAFGAVESIVIDKGADFSETLPAASVAVSVN